jgi:hypothetical protein
VIPVPTVNVYANGSDNPLTIPAGTSATIGWISSDASSCTASNAWSGIKGASGSESTGNLSAGQYTYTLTCTNDVGSGSDSFTLDVASAPTTDIKANNSNGPIDITVNTSVTISWTSTNATSCTVSPSGWTGTSGSQSTGNLSVGQYTYTVNCTGVGGSGSDSVVVNSISAPTVDIKGNNADGLVFVTKNTSATISWTSANATSCTVSPSGWTGTSGSQSTGNLSAGDYVYTVDCTSPLGPVSDSVTLRAGLTNIDSTYYHAWNDVIGWLDFRSTNSVVLSSSKLIGYASSSVGDISFNCASTRVGDICAQNNYSVTNDGNGNLSGWAWNDVIGWLSFDYRNTQAHQCGASYSYQGVAQPNGVDAGIFTSVPAGTDYAWNDVVGCISFNCNNHNGCSTANYKVITNWLAAATTGVVESVTFDTGIAGGAQLNSVMWQGSQPAGTSVSFQFAASNNSTGPWVYTGDNTPVNANTAQTIRYALYNNQRYFRYRMTLYSDLTQTASPIVESVVVNWSP